MRTEEEEEEEKQNQRSCSIEVNEHFDSFRARLNNVKSNECIFFFFLRLSSFISLDTNTTSE
jgi:hypothetical protein